MYIWPLVYLVEALEPIRAWERYSPSPYKETDWANNMFGWGNYPAASYIGHKKPDDEKFIKNI